MELCDDTVIVIRHSGHDHVALYLVFGLFILQVDSTEPCHVKMIKVIEPKFWVFLGPNKLAVIEGLVQLSG
jgi:hypothetical protein